MGKEKRKKFATPKPNPISAPKCEGTSVMSPEGEAEVAFIDETIQQLNSGMFEQQQTACLRIAGITSQPGAIPILLKQQVPRSLIPLLLSEAPALADNAAGALWNMCIDGGELACTEIVRQDAMTPLLALLSKFSEACESGAGGDATKASPSDSAVDVLNLLRTLCERSERAVELFNQRDALRLVLQLATCHAPTLAAAAGECLLSVAEDNAAVKTQLRDESVLQRLQDFTDIPGASEGQLLMLRTLRLAVLGQLVAEGSGVATSDPLLLKVLSALDDPLSRDVVEPMRSAAQAAADKTHALSAVTAGLEELCSVARAQQVACELLANICVADEEDEWEEMGSGDGMSSSGGEADEAMAEQEPQVASNGDSTPVHQAIHAFLPKVSALTGPPCDAAMRAALGDLPAGRRAIAGLDTVRCRALGCVANMVGLVCAHPGDAVTSLLTALWSRLAPLLLAAPEGGSLREASDWLEGLMSSLRAVLQNFPAPQALISGLGERELSVLSGFVTNADVTSSSRASVVGLVGACGSALARVQPLPPAFQTLGDVLLSGLEKAAGGGELGLAAECADALMDVFSEDETDAAAAPLALLPRLSSLAPRLLALLKEQRSTPGCDVPLVQQVLFNLRRFIKYKQKRLG